MEVIVCYKKNTSLILTSIGVTSSSENIDIAWEYGDVDFEFVKKELEVWIGEELNHGCP